MSSNAIESAKSTEDTVQNVSLPTVTDLPSANQNGTDQNGTDQNGTSQNSAAQNNGSGKNSRSNKAPDSSPTNTGAIDKLASALADKRLKKQLEAIRKLANMQAAGETVLADFVRDRMDEQNPEAPTAAHGSAYQVLYRASSDSAGSDAAKSLIAEFPEGLVCPQSDGGVDYSDLQKLLIKQDYQAADKLTNQKLCELAGESAIERKWVYFTEVSQFPLIDLQAIDILWGLYSEDKFGWSKQRDLWTRLGQDWERLWLQLQWKSAEGTWTRYPNEFIWDLDSAPVAHLPLSNQLRGVRTMDSLLGHPAWQYPWQE